MISQRNQDVIRSYHDFFKWLIQKFILWKSIKIQNIKYNNTTVMIHSVQQDFFCYVEYFYETCMYLKPIAKHFDMYFGI